MAVDEDDTETKARTDATSTNIALDVQLNVDADAMVRAQSIRLKRDKIAHLQRAIAQVRKRQPRNNQKKKKIDLNCRGFFAVDRGTQTAAERIALCQCARSGADRYACWCCAAIGAMQWRSWRVLARI